MFVQMLAKEGWHPQVMNTVWGVTNDLITLPNGDIYYYFKIPHKVSSPCMIPSHGYCTEWHGCQRWKSSVRRLSAHDGGWDFDLWCGKGGPMCPHLELHDLVLEKLQEKDHVSHYHYVHTYVRIRI